MVVYMRNSIICNSCIRVLHEWIQLLTFIWINPMLVSILPFKGANTAFGIHPILRKHNDGSYHCKTYSIQLMF